jgi:predicted DCC family thiol-disulfide oxidoreductase YuxK
LFVVSRLGGFWPALRVFGVLPTAMLDAVYDLIARYRYRLFGRYETCPVPATEHRERFIDI